jgi:hypothetical protein
MGNENSKKVENEYPELEVRMSGNSSNSSESSYERRVESQPSSPSIDHIKIPNNVLHTSEGIYYCSSLVGKTIMLKTIDGFVSAVIQESYYCNIYRVIFDDGTYIDLTDSVYLGNGKTVASLNVGDKIERFVVPGTIIESCKKSKSFHAGHSFGIHEKIDISVKEKKSELFLNNFNSNKYDIKEFIEGFRNAQDNSITASHSKIIILQLLLKYIGESYCIKSLGGPKRYLQKDTSKYQRVENIIKLPKNVKTYNIIVENSHKILINNTVLQTGLAVEM